MAVRHAHRLCLNGRSATPTTARCLAFQGTRMRITDRTRTEESECAWCSQDNWFCASSPWRKSSSVIVVGSCSKVEGAWSAATLPWPPSCSLDPNTFQTFVVIKESSLRTRPNNWPLNFDWRFGKFKLYLDWLTPKSTTFWLCLLLLCTYSEYCRCVIFLTYIVILISFY